MYYAKVTKDDPWGKSYEFYGFRSRRHRNKFVTQLNEDAEAHRNYRGHDVWPLMWTKYDHAEPLTADEFHKAMPDARIYWNSDGDRWTFYLPATLFKTPEKLTA